MTTTDMTSTAEDRAPARTAAWPGVPALLVGAPLLMAVARVLLVPFDDQDFTGTFDDMAAHGGRSDAGWLLAMAASGLLALTAVLLAQRLLQAGRTRVATFVAVATALGWAGCAAMGVVGLVMSEAALLPDRAGQVQLQENLNSGHTEFVFLMMVIGAVGYLVLAVSLARAGVVSKGVAALIGIGGAATLLTMPGPLTPLLVAAALLLGAGHALALRAVR